jgi:Flp pilus assembly protein TadD
MRCRQLWESRQRIVTGLSSLPPEVRTDLLDLAIIWSDLRARQATGAATPLHRDALRILAEAEQLYGTSSALQWERRIHEQALGGAAPPAPEMVPRTAWEHLVIGRSLLRSGKIAEARAELSRAAVVEPQDFWAQFYLGVAAYRQGDYPEAVQAFSICIALSPQTPVCYTNRALARSAMGTARQAEEDHARAQELARSIAPQADRAAPAR